MINHQDVLNMGAVEERLGKLAKRLDKYDFVTVVSALGGLLTRPENHPTTIRVEVLSHLAALRCRGYWKPSAANLREWLNDVVCADAVGRLEDPVEDVFVSNITGWFGNARIFEGVWEANDFYLQSCLRALARLGARPWVPPVRRALIALLGLSEAIAGRADVRRLVMSEGSPRQIIRVSTALMQEGMSRVTFSLQSLREFGIDSAALEPLLFDRDEAPALRIQTVGHTELERRPLVRTADGLVVALPTAISAAARRLVVERAITSGDTNALQKALMREQFERLIRVGLPGWKIEPLERFRVDDGAGTCEIVGTFDQGAFAHVVYLPDAVEAVARDGLQSIDALDVSIVRRIRARAEELTRATEYRRGMTILVHGGLGRGFAAAFDGAPSGWQHLGLSLHDLVLLGWADGFSALRVWKLLDQEDALAARGVRIENLNGFLNYYAFAERHGFELVPTRMNEGRLFLASNHVAFLRERLRRALDHHAVPLPGGTGWADVQRTSTAFFFKELREQPIYGSVDAATSGVLSGCVETGRRPWWVGCRARPGGSRQRSVVYQVWDMALNWLMRAAPLIEEALPSLPGGPVAIELVFPDIEAFDDEHMLSTSEHGVPKVATSDGTIVIICDLSYLRAFAMAENTGDQLMVRAIVEGASQLATAVPSSGTEAIVGRIVLDKSSRFFHSVPARNPMEMVHAAVNLPSPRFIQPEDRFWSRLGLVRRTGYAGPLGSVDRKAASLLLEKAVDVLWQDVRDRLIGLDRTSVVERALVNNDAIEKDRSIWRMTAAALTAMHQSRTDVLGAANARESDRAEAGISSRVLVEMAVCTAPPSGGGQCSTADLDALLACIATLIELAYYKDSIHYELAQQDLVVYENGIFRFDASFVTDMQRPYMMAHGERMFMKAADDYPAAFDRSGPARGASELDPAFEQAFCAEFGVGFVQLFDFAAKMAALAAERSTPTVRLRVSELKELLAKHADSNRPDADQTVESLSLKPRLRWDERQPANATARDWYPWRFNRRLSLLRRPFVQLTEEADSEILVSPTLLGRCVEYLAGAYTGQTPKEIFSTEAMRSWIGRAVDRHGHRFNEVVRKALEKLGLEARAEVGLTELGGPVELGDVDVLAWKRAGSVVYVVECKRLSFARTVGEIGERLWEYTRTAPQAGERTSVRKHLDRVDHLKANPKRISTLTGILPGCLKFKSCLVTDYLVPMQFSKQALELFDIITDIKAINKSFD